MSSKIKIDELIENFIELEKNTAFNPFLSTRIISAIDQKPNRNLLALSPTWRNVVIAFSLLIAVFAGIATGNSYHSNNESTSVVLMSDDKMENFSLYNEISN